MNKLSKIFLVIILILIIIIAILIWYIVNNFNNTLEDAEYSYETTIIYEAAGIEITSDNEGFYTVTDTINNNVLKTDFKVEINEDGTYKVINK